MVGLKQLLVATVFPLVLAACQSSPAPRGKPAPGRTLADMERVLAPMQERLSVFASRLKVDVSRELFDKFSYPSDSDRHQMRFTPGPPSTYRFRNIGGGVDVPMKFVIGKQTYLVLGTAELRVHWTGPARLDLEAGGTIIVNRPRSAPRDAAFLRVHDGKWEEKPHASPHSRSPR